MKFDLILDEVKTEAHPEEASRMKDYMKDQFSFLGVRTPLRRKLTTPFFKEEKNQPIDWAFIKKCWEYDARELQYVAIDYLAKKKLSLQPSDLARLQQYVETKSWWDTVDGLAPIIGSLIKRFPDLKTDMLKWSRSDNIWIRRVAILHQLLQKEDVDTLLLEEIIQNNLQRKEFFINKAIGWILRDYSKTNPEWVKHFIEKYKHQLAALSIREASKYL